MPDFLTYIRGQTQGRPLDWAIAELAERQHGVVARRQLLAIGVGSDRIQRALAAGRLHPIHRGVYAVGHRRLTRLGTYMAGVLAAGDGALLSHRSAGDLLGIARYSGALLEVTAPTAGRRSRGTLRMHTGAIHPEDRATADDVPVTSVARTVLDLAEVVSERRLVRTLERAEKLGVFDLAAIEAVIARSGGRRGLKGLRRALAMQLPEDFTRSPLERDFVDFCDRHGLPRPLVNAVRLGYEVDALWPEERLIVELDSWEHHRSRSEFESDRRRDAELTLAGYRVLRLTWRRLHAEPAAVAAQIRGLLAVAAPS